MEVACNLAPFAVASNNNLNPDNQVGSLRMEEDNGNDVVDNAATNGSSETSDDNSAKLVLETNGNVQQNGNVPCKYNNNINNNILVREEVNVSYDENHRVIEKSITTTLVNRNNQENNTKVNRVKFIDDEIMNQNLASSQPLVNGHLGNNPAVDLVESQKLANSHPHVTISSDPPRGEDRAFRTKIDNSYQGWDNPFRPEGELSHDADEILRLWKEGKLKDFSLLLKAKEEKKDEELDIDSNEPLLNGNSANTKNGHKTLVDVKTSSVLPLKSEKVTVSDEPKKKQGCCSLM